MTTWVKYWDDSFNPVPLSRLDEMYAAGYRVWGRYVGMGSAAKHFTSAEIRAWFALGDDTGVAILAEAYGTEPITTPSLGDDHALSARSAARALGIPDSVAISPAVDRNISKSDWTGNVAQYMRNWKAADTRPPVPYCEEDAGDWLHAQGISLGTFTAAAYAWNDNPVLFTPTNAPAHVVMTQEHNGKPMAGGVVDIGHVRVDAPLVWWKKPINTAPTEDDMELTDKVTLFDKPDVTYSSPEVSVETILASTNYYVLQTRNQMNAKFAQVIDLLGDSAKVEQAIRAALTSLPAGVTVDQATLQGALVGALKQLAADDDTPAS